MGRYGQVQHMGQVQFRPWEKMQKARATLQNNLLTSPHLSSWSTLVVAVYLLLSSSNSLFLSLLYVFNRPPRPIIPLPSRRYHCSCEPQAVAETFPTLKLKRFSFFPEKVSAFFPVFFSGMINFGKVSGLFPELCLGMANFLFWSWKIFNKKISRGKVQFCTLTIISMHKTSDLSGIL